MSANPQIPAQQPSQETPAPRTGTTPDVIASRKGCTAEGVGLSHYILMDRKAP
jgi:modified peptide precursor CbpA